jgi:hypothetical protein
MESLTLLRLLAVYVALTVLDNATGGGPLRSVVNALGVAMPIVMLGYFAAHGIRIGVPRGLAIGYGMLAGGLLLSVVVAGLYNFADLTKFLLAPLFAILGYNASAFDADDAWAMAKLRTIAVVLLILPIGYALLQGWDTTPGAMLGIFANRNNAALYVVVLSNVLFLMGASVGLVVVALTVAALAFSTLGVLMAVVVALLLSLSVRRYLPAYVVAALVVAFLMFGPIELPIAERLQRLGEGVGAITELGLWTELSNLSYADLYRITGENTDLSLFFRIKHWEDLLTAWTAHGWTTTAFGLGIGSAPFHTDIGLVPHNDYVRFLVESGPLGFLGFASITGWLLWTIGRRALLMSTAAVAIYFFSENLVDNFAAMTLYYWFAGYWARHAEQPTLVEDDEPTDAGNEGDSVDYGTATPTIGQSFGVPDRG